MSALVKICGVTRGDQAQAIAEAGADFIGVNFWPQSKRFLSPKKALEWAGSWSAKAGLVGVFVNADPRHLEAITQHIPLFALQLHGDETPEECTRLMERGHRVIKAFQVRDEASLDRIADYSVPDILLDTYHPGERGGVGATFPWKLALAFKSRYPDRRLWLAGGLTPENVASAAQSVAPYAVDVASGVEDELPGIKDLAKVRQFIRAAKA